MINAYDTQEKRDRLIDMFAAMGRDDAFMLRTADEVARRLGDKPVLLLFGQLDPVRLAGGVSRVRRCSLARRCASFARRSTFPSWLRVSR